MTLRQAYKSWAMAPRNMILAKNSKDAVEKVLMKKYSDIDLENFTAGFVQSLFEKCNEPQQIKTKAASILVYVLCWGGDHDYCKRPNFDYTIASATVKKEQEERTIPKPLYELSGSEILKDEPIVKVKKEAYVKRIKDLKEIIESQSKDVNKYVQENKDMNTKMKEPKEICQLDPLTFKVIATFPSSVAARKATGACNVCRAAQKHSPAGGYYWAFPNEVEGFKPAVRKIEKIADNTQEKEQKADSEPKNGQKPIGMTTDMQTLVLTDIRLCSDEELIAEIKRRGWKGTLEIVKHITL